MRFVAPMSFLGIACLGGLLLFLTACRPEATGHSELFLALFAPDSATFRGLELGDDIREVLAQEAPHQPEHRDKLGLTYHFDLADSARLLIDYYTDNLKTERESNRLTSILANLKVGDEVETARLYDEVQAHLSRHYGLAGGAYGRFEWRISAPDLSSMEVRLLLDDNKQGITLNYIDTQPGRRFDLSQDDFRQDSLFSAP